VPGFGLLIINRATRTRGWTDCLTETLSAGGEITDAETISERRPSPRRQRRVYWSV